MIMPGNPELKKKELKYAAQFHEDQGSIERRQMENKANSGVSIHFLEWFYPKRHYGFIVNLKHPLSDDEIRQRMMKGFGDLGFGSTQ